MTSPICPKCRAVTHNGLCLCEYDDRSFSVAARGVEIEISDLDEKERARYEELYGRPA